MVIIARQSAMEVTQGIPFAQAIAFIIIIKGTSRPPLRRRESYDEIEICEESTAKHFKTAFQVRNRRMVDRTNLVVFYVETSEDGAYQTMQYAIQQGKDLINLYHAKEDQQ